MTSLQSLSGVNTTIGFACSRTSFLFLCSILVSHVERERLIDHGLPAEVKRKTAARSRGQVRTMEEA